MGQCPKCGRPIAPTTIEQTGKSDKAAILFGALSMIAGCAMFCANLGGTDPQSNCRP